MNYKPGTLLRYTEISGYFEIMIILSYCVKNNQTYILFYRVASFSDIMFAKVCCRKVTYFILDNYEVLYEL